MILQNDFELLPCSEEDYFALSKKDSIAGARVLVLHPLETAIPFYKSLGFMEVAADNDEFPNITNLA